MRFKSVSSRLASNLRSSGGSLSIEQKILANNAIALTGSSFSSSSTSRVWRTQERSFVSPGQQPVVIGRKKLTKCMVELSRRGQKPGSLNRILEVFEKHRLNLTHIESKLHCFTYDGLCFHLDFEGRHDDERVRACLGEIRQLKDTSKVEILPAKDVPWFPCSIKELDQCVATIDGGETGGLIDPDHPGFNDPEYRKRREMITEIGNSYRYGEKMQDVEYTPDEVKTWQAVYEKLRDYHQRWACDEYLKSRTGFQLRPVNGLLSARDFLNALAFRVFCSTQYIRHGGNPFYTPEPDVCHELIGHVPLLADKHFADFTQEVGLASLGASDDEIVKLASIYWFTVEFGLVKSRPDKDGNREIRVMGAGILSSFGEMEWSASDVVSEETRKMGGIARDYPDLKNPKIVEFDPRAAAEQPYPITTYQPIYFCGDSVQDVKERISEYCDTMERSFHPVYDPITQTVEASRAVRRLPRSTTGDQQAAKQKEYFDKLNESKEIYSINTTGNGKI